MGGIKQIFRHVEALTDAGFDAYVLANENNVPPWFESSAPIAVLQHSICGRFRTKLLRQQNPLEWIGSTSTPRVEMLNRIGTKSSRSLTAADIIVIPEFYGKLLKPCGFGSKVVIFNQNAHYTFNGFRYCDDLDGSIYPENVSAVLAVSRHVFAYLQYAFPELKILLTPNGVDCEKFRFESEKKQQIAFMPRKLPHDIVQVIQILKARGTLKGWQLCPIDGATEDQVAQIMRESAIFLSTCDAEGFGLPPLEAGACGCIVIGYCGQAASEFMLPEYCFPIAQGDVVDFARTVEKATLEYIVNPHSIRQRASDHAKFIRDNYSISMESARVVDAWSNLCGAEIGPCRWSRQLTV